jgi:catechol 2,3-dioxygenase-like lactoylglutathione lyase family enzyme
MIDHLSLAVSDLARARAFYDAALAPLGYRRIMDFGQTAGYGDGHPGFWIAAAEDGAAPLRPAPGSHIAFVARDRAAVEAFHRAALAAGGTDNGAPGLRSHYHPDYYAAFVLDPDGNRLEAVCHRPG